MQLHAYVFMSLNLMTNSGQSTNKWTNKQMLLEGELNPK